MVFFSYFKMARFTAPPCSQASRKKNFKGPLKKYAPDPPPLLPAPALDTSANYTAPAFRFLSEFSAPVSYSWGVRKHAAGGPTEIQSEIPLATDSRNNFRLRWNVYLYIRPTDVPSRFSRFWRSNLLCKSFLIRRYRCRRIPRYTKVFLAKSKCFSVIFPQPHTPPPPR